MSVLRFGASPLGHAFRGLDEGEGIISKSRRVCRASVGGGVATGWRS